MDLLLHPVPVFLFPWIRGDHPFSNLQPDEFSVDSSKPAKTSNIKAEKEPEL